MRIMFNLFILSIITMSAFSVIYIKHKNRFMNIDIEGHELEVLKGADRTLSKVNCLVIEIRLENIQTYKIKKILLLQ